MLCTYIYFVDIGSFVVDEMPPPPNDQGVDAAKDQEMADEKDRASDITGPHDHGHVPVGVRHRLDTRFRISDHYVTRLLDT